MPATPARSPAASDPARPFAGARGKALAPQPGTEAGRAPAGGLRAAARGAAAGEAAAWAAQRTRSAGWLTRLAERLDDPRGRAALAPALRPGAALRRAALLARYLPQGGGPVPGNLEVPLRRHLAKAPDLGSRGLGLATDATVVLVVLMDPALLERLLWWRTEAGWGSLRDALQRGDGAAVPVARALRRGVEAAHAGRWEEAAARWTEGLSALARRASAGAGRKGAFDAVDLAAPPEQLRPALEAWWRGFVPAKPAAGR
ncbi:MAG: hypothetical protein D6731_03785 [Planctomycetota bacterium]|nr:MAG: hypothetical protein D6731_03785 [Planctomycetota bacterium]